MSITYLTIRTADVDAKHADSLAQKRHWPCYLTPRLTKQCGGFIKGLSVWLLQVQPLVVIGISPLIHSDPRINGQTLT